MFSNVFSKKKNHLLFFNKVFSKKKVKIFTKLKGNN